MNSEDEEFVHVNVKVVEDPHRIQNGDHSERSENLSQKCFTIIPSLFR